MNAKITLGFLFFLSTWLLPVTPVFSQSWRTLGDSRIDFRLHLNSFVSVSPDGKFLLAAEDASSDHFKTLKRPLALDATNGKLLRALSGSGPQHVYSPDARLFYTSAQADFATPAETPTAIIKLIEVFSHRQRRHSSLGQVSPAGYEQFE